MHSMLIINLIEKKMNKLELLVCITHTKNNGNSMDTAQYGIQKYNNDTRYKI